MLKKEDIEEAIKTWEMVKINAEKNVSQSDIYINALKLELEKCTSIV